jgi:N-acetylglutamate synthase-like GNAT family acetyltransferase
MANEGPPAAFTEKEFYLDEFRGRTLLFAVHHDGPPEDLAEVGEVARDLTANDARALVLLGGAAAADPAALAAVARPLGRAPRALAIPAETVDRPEVDRALLRGLWRVVRAQPLFVGLCAGSAPERLAAFAGRLAARLRVHKLVIADPGGGVRGAGAPRPLSFMDEAMVEQLLHAGEAEWVGLGSRRALLVAIRRALLAGVGSVNLCTLDGLARELFTYEGSGTLFTREDYCKVEPLGLDDFHEVEKLLERGQREGYLKPRDAEETAQILLAGFGATIGRHHLAGVCALDTERYAGARAGEIVGLYTMTRFKGEGVGIKLIDRMKAEGRARGLAYLFACTTDERVRQFFERQGFRRVPQDAVPPAKWEAYDAARRGAIAVYRFDLTG